MYLNPTASISEATLADMKAMGIIDTSGINPQELFNWNALFTFKGFILIVVGGFLVGFGTRYANGCTSGHAIMGLSILNWASLIAVVGFFVGGLVMTHLIFPFIF